jgi:hypothetical protein
VAGRHRRTPAQGRHRKPPQRGHVLVPAVAVAAVLSIGGVGASAALSSNGTPKPRPAPTTAAPIPTPPQANAPTPAPPAVTATSPAAPAPRPLPDFAITVTRSLSWVQVVGPRGRVLFAGFLRRGRTLSYSQRPLTVTLGDAGVVRLVVHHHARYPAGRRGAVLHFVVR